MQYYYEYRNALYDVYTTHKLCLSVSTRSVCKLTILDMEGIINVGVAVMHNNQELLYVYDHYLIQLYITSSMCAGDYEPEPFAAVVK